MTGMTEDEAKTKWCPHTGVVATFEPRNNMSGAQCIASACMAWRSVVREVWVDKTGLVVTDPSMFFEPRLTKISEGGYCGLAGSLV